MQKNIRKPLCSKGPEEIWDGNLGTSTKLKKSEDIHEIRTQGNLRKSNDHCRNLQIPRNPRNLLNSSNSRNAKNSMNSLESKNPRIRGETPPLWGGAPGGPGVGPGVGPSPDSRRGQDATNMWFSTFGDPFGLLRPLLGPLRSLVGVSVGSFARFGCPCVDFGQIVGPRTSKMTAPWPPPCAPELRFTNRILGFPWFRRFTRKWPRRRPEMSKMIPKVTHRAPKAP